MKTIVEAKNIYLRISGKVILSNFNLMLNAGDKLVLCGSSGKGKTTILNVLTGFHTDYDGELSVFGKENSPENIVWIRKKIAWLPQNFNLEQGSVDKIIARIFSIRTNLNNKPSLDKIEKVFQALNLKKDLLYNDFENLSGGEKQRVGLSICYLQQKNLIILDEPTASLDEESASKVIALFLKNTDMTVLSTSHDAKWIAACTKEVHL